MLTRRFGVLRRILPDAHVQRSVRVHAGLMVVAGILGRRLWTVLTLKAPQVEPEGLSERSEKP